jgi:hypothetical protein
MVQRSQELEPLEAADFLRAHLRLGIAELDGVCTGCTFKRATDECSAVRRPYRPRLSVVR